jgi:hypothetical protein
LYRTYTCLAEELYEEAPSLSIEYLKKAFHMANEGTLVIIEYDMIVIEEDLSGLTTLINVY